MDIENMSLAKLKELAKKNGLHGYSKYSASDKHELVSQLKKVMKTKRDHGIDQMPVDLLVIITKKMTKPDIASFYLSTEGNDILRTNLERALEINKIKINLRDFYNSIDDRSLATEKRRGKRYSQYEDDFEIDQYYDKNDRYD